MNIKSTAHLYRRKAKKRLCKTNEEETIEGKLKRFPLK